jgi:hypothetical protein
MYSICKYNLAIVDEQIVKIKGFVSILSVEEQYDGIVLYALVDITPDLPEMEKTIFIHGTGHEFTMDNKCFIGTVKLHEGWLMFHVFEKR